MKTKTPILAVLIAAFLSSCVPLSTNFYQVYKVVPASDIALKNNALIFEDASCKVTYDLWSDGGNIGFLFTNKTATNIYINLEECFFVKNGIAYNYFKNRVYTTSSTFGSTTSLGTNSSRTVTGVNYLNLIQTNSGSLSSVTSKISTSGSSVSINEDKVICIPANTSKSISEYNINDNLYRDCDLFRYPNQKEIKSLTFTDTNSPFICSNRIEYKLGQTGAPVKIENKFYVSEICNYPEAEITKEEREKYCGQEKIYSRTINFKNVSPDKFYIKYYNFGGAYSQDIQWKH